MRTVVECRPRGALGDLRHAAAGFAARWPRQGALALVLAACALLPLVQRAEGTEPAARAIEWPRELDGRVLRPMSLSPVEQRFANAFPGAIGRFFDGERLVVLRHVQRPTRMLHPAADCYRGLGWRVEDVRLEHDRRARLWRCFTARRDGQAPLRVCERIEGAQGDHGEAWTDASAWFWAAVLGRTRGPWQAVTTVVPFEEPGS